MVLNITGGQLLKSIKILLLLCRDSQPCGAHLVCPASFFPDWLYFFFCHCWHISSEWYVCSMCSCGNWLLTVKDLLTLKSVVCVLRAPCSAGQLLRLCRFNSPNTCLLFPPSKLQKSKSALPRRCLWACSEQRQLCLMCDVHYAAS